MIVYHFTRVGYSVVGSEFPYVCYVSIVLYVPTSNRHPTLTKHLTQKQ